MSRFELPKVSFLASAAPKDEKMDFVAVGNKRLGDVIESSSNKFC